MYNIACDGNGCIVFRTAKIKLKNKFPIKIANKERNNKNK